MRRSLCNKSLLLLEIRIKCFSGTIREWRRIIPVDSYINLYADDLLLRSPCDQCSTYAVSEVARRYKALSILILDFPLVNIGRDTGFSTLDANIWQP